MEFSTTRQSKKKSMYALLATMILLGMGASPTLAELTLEQLRQQREIAKNRPRNLIYNNDGADVIYSDDHTPQGLLDVRTSGLVGTQVDTINYCSRSSGFGLFTHNTQVGEIFTSTGGRYYNNMTQDLIDQGTDVLDVMVDFARDNDIEIFWSMRMNDTHDAHSESAIYAFPQLKRDHPEWLMGTETNRPAYGAWTAIDYGVEDVRDLALAYCEEVCLNYDVDGIELDFFRHPYFFRSHANGGTATQADRAMMTDLIRDIRVMTEQVGMQREKPILVSVRVPDSVGYCSDIGLDIVEWLDEGLIDIMTASGNYRAREWEDSVALGHQYDVKVYGGLSESRMSGEAGTIRKSQDSYRARASNVWQSGADGVYMFNYFNDDSELWEVLGDTETLRGRDKVFTTGARGVEEMRTNLVNGLQYLDRDVVSPERPLGLTPGQLRTIQMPVGDDIAGTCATPGQPPLEARVALRLYVDNLIRENDLDVRLNGVSPGELISRQGFYEYRVDPSLVAQGMNAFQIGLESGASQSATLRDLQLWVGYKPETTAAPILRESFQTAVPADPAQGEYSLGNLVGTGGQNPAVTPFDGAWSRGKGSFLGVFKVVETGLSHPDVDTQGGAVRFLNGISLTETQSARRAFDAGLSNDDGKTYYLTGMMSFDEAFNTAVGSQAWTGMLNAEEGDLPLTIGLQWGFQGNGNGGVDAVVRYRDNQSPDYPLVTETLAGDLETGSHLFVMKVRVDISGATDELSVWLDPDDLWSEEFAGTPTFSDLTACWLKPLSDPDRPVDTLVFNATDVGAGASVLFDEIRLAETWDDLFLTVDASATPLPGDLNGDGFVGGDDLDIVRSFWGQNVPAGELLAGDPSGDGFVGGDDLDMVRANWGQGTPPIAPAAVPEPATFTGVLAILAVGMVFYRRLIIR